MFQRCFNVVIGAEFVRDQLFFLEVGKKEMTEEKVEKWTMPLTRLKNGHQMDRAVFFDGTCPFLACAWDGKEYTWMRLLDNVIMQVPDFKWDDVTVMVPY